MAKGGRRVRGKQAPVASSKGSRLGRLINSLKPANIKTYWLSRQGAMRMLKIAGAGFLLLFLTALYFAKDLPSPSKINARLGAQTTQFYDRTGKHLLYETFGNKNRRIITFEDMPENIKQATVAVEDRNFYQHGAFSSIGILRAAFVNAFCNGCGTQGGSTITQQYVKNALLSPERTLTRKIKELILSIIIEQFYRKDDILKLYLNEIPYGSNAYGIEGAAKTYFEKPAKELTLDEAALMAAIPRAPTYYSPYGQHKDVLLKRQDLILDLMAEQGFISKSAAKAAKKVDTLAKIPEVQNLYANLEAPHFVLYVQEQLEEKYGTRVVSEGGLKIITTLDWDKQKAAEEAIKKNMNSVRSSGGSNSALVAFDPKTGQLLAMVGSYQFQDPEFGAFNVATAERQPGSSFKPLAYATAWAGNYGPGTTLYDVPTDFGGGYKPQNYSQRNYGVQSMRTSLAGSLNIPAVKTLYLAGIDKTIKQSHKMGITTLKRGVSNYGLSLVLGAGEVKLVDMVNAYESFANGGVHHDPVLVMKITNPSGKVLEQFQKKKPKRVLDAQIAYLMSHVLSDNAARGYIFGSLLNISGRTVAVKTGTTESYRDAWTMGYTPSLVAGVWTGNNNNKSMNRAAAAISAPIWRDFMVKALEGKPNEQFERPAGIKEVVLDAQTGKLATESTKNKRTDMFPSWYKPPTAAAAKSATIDKISGKLATDCTPPLAREEATSSEMHAEIPASDPAYGRWEPPVAALARSLGYKDGGTLPTESDDAHHCSDTKPTVNLDVDHLSGSYYQVRSVVSSGTFTANKLEIYLDDQIISTQTISGSTTYEFTHRVTSTGTHVFKAVVTDSGLYQGDDSDTVSVSSVSAAADFKGLSPTGNVNGFNVNFTWTEHPAADKYELFVDGVSRGTANNESKTTAVAPFGAHNWYVRALDNANNVIATTAVLAFTNSP